MTGADQEQDGFILEASYRLENGAPVVHCYGVLRSGDTFLLRDHRKVPHFFVRARDAQAARQLGAAIIGAPGMEPADFRSMSGEPLRRVETRIPGDVPPLRDRLHAQHIPSFEADVRFAVSYLLEHGVRGSCVIRGEPKPSRRGVAVEFDNADLTPGGWVPQLRALSFDIETDMKAQRLLAISLHGCGADEVLLLSPPGFATPAAALGFANEADLLRAFVARVQALDPDVLTGWNVIDFDLKVLLDVARRTRVPLALARGSGVPKLRPARSFWARSEVLLPGRLVLDGMALLQGSFIRTSDYSLDTVAHEVLGEGKTIHTDGNRGLEIQRLFREDREAFVHYSRTDAQLVLRILDKLHLLPLTLERSRLTGMTPDRVNASIASFDFLYMMHMHRRGIVAPNVKRGDEVERIGQAGGHVLSPTVGLWNNVWVFDFKSLYPSLMRTFNIDPLQFVQTGDQESDDLIEAPNGARFRRGDAILPALLDELFTRRERAKREHDNVTSQAVKILMNSFYGVLGTSACRFHNADIANAITSFGKYFLLWTKAWFEARGYDVLYGDTDSLFVRSGLDDTAGAHAAGAVLARSANEALQQHIEQRWRVASKMELEFEKTYAKLFLPAMRGGGGGARKRYVGLVHDDASGHLEFVGMEVVRRDWTDLAKDVQRELYARLFAEQPVTEYLTNVLKDLRSGKLDDLLVYRKALRKGLEQYTDTTPPHVVAARKAEGDVGRSVHYVITTTGPEPRDARTSPIDREHYVDKQIKPVAEPVLAVLGLQFDTALGERKQMDLF